MLGHWNLQKINSPFSKSFLLLEAMISMVLVSLFIISFINVSTQNHKLPSYASRILFQKAVKNGCSQRVLDTNILGMKFRQNFMISFDKNLNKKVLIISFSLDDTIRLKRRCYI